MKKRILFDLEEKPCPYQSHRESPQMQQEHIQFLGSVGVTTGIWS